MVGRLVAPESPVCELVFVDSKKFCTLPLMFLPLRFIFLCYNKKTLLLGWVFFIVFVVFASSYVVCLYMSLQKDILR